MHRPHRKSELKHWKAFFTSPQTPKGGFETTQNNETGFEYETSNWQLVTSNQQLATSNQPTVSQCIQLHLTYIIATTQNGFILVHQQLAHERVLYEKYSVAAHGTQMVTQKSMFPVSLELALLMPPCCKTYCRPANDRLPDRAIWQPHICDTRHASGCIARQ